MMAVAFLTMTTISMAAAGAAGASGEARFSVRIGGYVPPSCRAPASAADYSANQTDAIPARLAPVCTGTMLVSKTLEAAPAQGAQESAPSTGVVRIWVAPR
jgi:hypothetical protein